MADAINNDLKHENPLFIGVLNGVFMFAGELMQYVNIPCEITFVKLSSYNGTASSGIVKTSIGLQADVRGRNIVILEDIIDTGKTVTAFVKQLQEHHPESIRIATLLFKPDAMENDLEINYLRFKVADQFLVGFGLDYD